MANVEKQRNRLIKLLKELFQLDQPDLDFGFYKIMHAKADTVSNFLENDLLGIIKDAFGEVDTLKTDKMRLTYEAAIKQAEDFGAPDPKETSAVKKAKAIYDAAKDSSSNEGDVYEHLYRFFERYYDNGDFMSRRYFMRETDGRAAPYAVPYDGREVYLHWANRDQYYIKTSEYLTNFTFDLLKSEDIAEGFKKLSNAEKLIFHCRIIDASEGDHNNVKASESTTRFFVLYEDEPVVIEVNDAGIKELVIQFEYKPLPNKKYLFEEGREDELKSKYGAQNKGDLSILDMADKILENLPEEAKAYKEYFSTIVSTDKITKRPLIAKYLVKYTARNTMDYFIHKDLGGFLRRELDFYIKNEIMRLDDIEFADVPAVESYLEKIKVLRKIAGELITFLTQLEEFQKKLWLKKKFVTETNYCITLDRVSERFYPEIAANDAQRQEWVKLFAIDEIQMDLDRVGYNEPLTIDFLKCNPFLVLDTVFFTEEFKNNLLSEIQHIDERTDGLLICAENSQALRLIRNRYQKQINTVITDPPYNTGDDGFHYKDNYSHSSWNSMIDERIKGILPLLDEVSWLSFNINDIEFKNLVSVLESNDVATAFWTIF